MVQLGDNGTHMLRSIEDMLVIGRQST
jgi:hypothetical protein